MQIVCPNCKTSYQVAPAAIGARGRSVRCVRCHHVWFVPTLGSMPAPAASKRAPVPPGEKAASDAAVAAFGAELGTPSAPPPAVEPGPPRAPAEQTTGPGAADGPGATPAAESAEGAPVGLSDVTIAIDDAPPLVPQPGEGGQAETISAKSAADVESVAARRASAAKRRRFRIPLPLAIVILAAAVAAVLGLRNSVVRHVPQLASFYSALGLPVNLRGVAFTDLKIGNEIHDGVPVLVVEGAIVSITSKPVELPRIRFALRNASGAEIYAWTVPPSQKVLEPFDSITFRSRLAAPPAEGHDVQVRFFTARDATATR